MQSGIQNEKVGCIARRSACAVCTAALLRDTDAETPLLSTTTSMTIEHNFKF